MKKLTVAQRDWFRRHAKHSAKSKLRSARKRAAAGRLKAAQLNAEAAAREGRQVIPIRRRNHLKMVIPPKVLSLARNYDEFVDFIQRFRSVTLKERRNVRIDFTVIQEVSPAATLMLVAEIDRWRRHTGVKLRAIDVDKWNPEVRRQLQEQGIFKVLEVSSPPDPIVASTPEQRRLITFRSENLTLGEAADAMQNALMEAVGRDLGIDDQALYIGLTEAMTNAVQHAYPKDWEFDVPPLHNRWWMSGSYEPATQKMTVQLFDQGIGIPAHLPRSTRWRKVRGWFLDKIGKLPGLDEIHDDALMIRAATETGETGSSMSGRGYGLGNIREFIDKSPAGLLRILSGRGEYVYRPGDDPKLINHSTGIGGTLIEWRVTLSSQV